MELAVGALISAHRDGPDIKAANRRGITNRKPCELSISRQIEKCGMNTSLVVTPRSRVTVLTRHGHSFVPLENGFAPGVRWADVTP